MRNIKACIFDLDGVIVDTAKYHYLAWKRLAAELGFDFSLEDNERLKGISRMASLDILLSVGKKSFDNDSKLILAEKKNRWYVNYISQMDDSEILPGIKAFMDHLKARNIKIALGSASKNAELILRNLKLSHYFDATIDGTKTSKAKPDPEVFLLAARELGISPESCVVFEDAQAGVEAAKNAGMYCVGIGAPELLFNADLVIPGFEGVTLDKLDLNKTNNCA